MKAVWEFLNSLKLTVYLILAITGITMFGSFVLYLHPEVFGDMDQSLFFPWLFTAGPKHFNYTWWLYVLVLMVVLLGLNTLVCSVERLPLLVKRYRDPLLNLRDIELGGGDGREAALGERPGETLAGFLKARRYSVYIQGDGLYAEKNRWLPFMPYVVHAGIMVFMVGHLISGLYGYRHSGLYIFEGETAKSPAGEYHLRLNKVKIETRPDGSLKDFGSNLTAIKDGREIKTGWVTANTPMFVEGGAVYQREFNQGVRGVYIYAEVKSAGFRDYVYVPKGSGYAEIPGTHYRVGVDELVSDFAVDEGGRPYSASEDLANPAVLASLYRGEERVSRGWLVLRDPAFGNFSHPDVSLKMAELDVRMYSSFDVNRDPSALIALFASLTVMLVTVVTLYFRRERVWARIDEAGGRAQVLCTDDELYEKLSSR